MTVLSVRPEPLRPGLLLLVCQWLGWLGTWIHSTGGDAQIILSGPIVKELGFNTAEGPLRDGYRANSSVGRFLRLNLRNVAGFLPGAGALRRER